jgi:hypothetical protein
MAAKSSLCAALGNNVFDYGHRAAEDQMRTSWEKLIQFVGTNYGQDISNELQNKIPVILAEPVHTPEVLARHAIHEQMVQTGEENLQRAHLSKRIILETAAALGADPDAPMHLAILDNEIAEGNYKQNNEVPIEMSDSEKREECATDKTQRAGILSHPWSVHSVASRQNEAGYQLEYGKHIIQPFGIVSADRENDSCADRGSIPVPHCVRPGTKLLLILAGDNVQLMLDWLSA